MAEQLNSWKARQLVGWLQRVTAPSETSVTLTGSSRVLSAALTPETMRMHLSDRPCGSRACLWWWCGVVVTIERVMYVWRRGVARAPIVGSLFWRHTPICVKTSAELRCCGSLSRRDERAFCSD